MKKLTMLCLAALGLLTAGGCGSDAGVSPGFPQLPDMPATKGETDVPAFTATLTESQKENVKSILDVSSMTALKLTDFDFYRKEGDEGWTKEDFSEWEGLSAPGYADVILRDGKAWVPLELFDLSTGPHILSIPLEAYRNYTGFKKSFYVACPLEYDEDTSTLEIGRYSYQVCGAEGDELKVRHISPFWMGGVEGIAGYHLFDICYKKWTIETYDNLYYGSELEAYLAIIEMVREKLGSKINANMYLSGVILDQPYFDLDEIESEIRARYGSDEELTSVPMLTI